MEAEETVVVLSDDILRTEEVVERPLLAERPNIRTEDGCGKRAEIARLVHGDQEVLDLQRLEFKIARLGEMAERCGVERVVWVPGDRTSVCNGRRARVSKCSGRYEERCRLT